MAYKECSPKEFKCVKCLNDYTTDCTKLKNEQCGENHLDNSHRCMATKEIEQIKNKQTKKSGLLQYL